jgi:N-acetylglutamate synthase-like GNAT family acetyltransferase
MAVRVAKAGDLEAVLGLLKELNPDDLSHPQEQKQIFEKIQQLPHLDIIVADFDDRVVGTCYLNVIPNLTRGARPYAILENVVVTRELRGRGIGREMLSYALNRAWESGCYKVMLQTGSHRESTHRFYRECGFKSDGRFAFVARPERNGG